MYRCRLFTDYLKDSGAARTLYQRALDIDYPDTAVKSFRGFVLLQLGRKADAISWMESILSEVKDIDGSINYYGACFYAQLGMTEKAFACMENSLENGYADYYNWTRYDDCSVSVAPLREDSRFTRLLDQYNYLFN